MLREPERLQFLNIVADADRCLVSVLSVYETAIVLRFRGGAGGIEDLFEYLDVMRAEIVTFDLPQVHSALAAYGRFGKGVNPESRLNLCDCIAYALAKTLNVPLLYKGSDFRQTDILAAA